VYSSKRAVKRQVNKETPNKGLWCTVPPAPSTSWLTLCCGKVWTCARHSDDPGYCGFFLWESEAKLHEQRASPPQPPAPRTPSKHKPSPIKLQQPTPTTASPSTRKRPRDGPTPLFGSNRAPSIQRVQGWLLTESFEEENEDEIFATAPPSPTHAASMKARRTSFQTSPSKQLSLNYPKLPSFVSDTATVPDDDIFQCPPSVPRSQRGGIFNTQTSPQKLALPLVREVLDLLDDEISEGTTAQLADILAVHAKRYDGVVLGREATRQLVTKRDAEIGELNERIRVLEEENAWAKRELDRVEKERTAVKRDFDGLESKLGISS